MGFWNNLKKDAKKTARKLDKKAYEKNTVDNNAFLKKYTVLINGYLRFTEDNEKVTKELIKLQDDFYKTVATSDTGADKEQDKITKLFGELETELTKPSWDETIVLHTIRNIGLELDKMNSMRENI